MIKFLIFFILVELTLCPSMPLSPGSPGIPEAPVFPWSTDINHHHHHQYTYIHKYKISNKKENLSYRCSSVALVSFTSTGSFGTILTLIIKTSSLVNHILNSYDLCLTSYNKPVNQGSRCIQDFPTNTFHMWLNKIKPHQTLNKHTWIRQIAFEEGEISLVLWMTGTLFPLGPAGPNPSLPSWPCLHEHMKWDAEEHSI